MYSGDEKKQIATLLEIMQALRDPDHGCPWDKEQSFKTVVPYTIEEAYEVAGAIEHDDMDELCDELGDLLFQVVFHARIAEENGDFNFADVVFAIADKMLRRHPHVFGSEDERRKGATREDWERIKAWERATKKRKQRTHGLLDDVPGALPALMRAEKLQKRAARAGFDWPETEPVFDKIQEELVETREAVSYGDQDRIADEVGDLLFSCVNLARHLGVDPEVALRGANHKFTRRFTDIENKLHAQNQDFSSLAPEELDALWDEVKAQNRRVSP